MEANMRASAYAASQKWLHWIVALFVFCMIPMGFYMVARGEATKFDALTNTLYSYHKMFGFILLWLVALRFVIRLRRGAPAPEASLSGLHVAAANLVHKLLYALLFLVPLLGWLGVSAYPALDLPFGLKLPALLPVNEGMAEKLFGFHELAAKLLLGFLLLHVAAALYHHLIRKDGVLRRMLPGG